jgi:hypothetical protein
MGRPSLPPRSRCPCKQVLQTLRAASHNGFPVYSQTATPEGYPAARPTVSPQPSLRPEGTPPALAGAALGRGGAGSPYLQPPPAAAGAGAAAGLEFGELSAAHDKQEEADEAAGGAGAEAAPFSAGEGPGPVALEGLILRSQLLVLLQRRRFCNAAGQPLGAHAADERVEFDLEVGG